MVVIYVILAIILLIFIILHFSVVADIDISNHSKKVKVKFLFFNIFPKEKKKKNKKVKKSKNKNKKLNLKKRKKIESDLEKEKEAYNQALKKAAKLNEQTENLNSANKEQGKTKQKPKQDNKKESKKDKFDDLKEKWESIKLYLPLGKKVFKRLIKSIRISGLKDAYECAMMYGKANAAIYNALCILKLIFTVSVNQIYITSKFNSSETDYNLKCRIKVRPSTIIAIAFCALIGYLRINLKKKRIDKKSEINNKEMEMLKNG